ncbi:MAG: hypothetical protein K2L76_02380 [Muribaculaceae bacterium]|nr:hypothetical protein [Muribaculaceae bacterium]
MPSIPHSPSERSFPESPVPFSDATRRPSRHAVTVSATTISVHTHAYGTTGTATPSNHPPAAVPSVRSAFTTSLFIILF